jgi:14-3-3 protein epsilon
MLMQHTIPKVEKRMRDKKITLVEERAFFYKMVGDYNRYASESCQSVFDAQDRLVQFKQGALNAYGKSLDLCNRGGDNGIQPYNPVKLGLALNFSVFYFEIIGDSRKACSIAK